MMFYFKKYFFSLSLCFYCTYCATETFGQKPNFNSVSFWENIHLFSLDTTMSFDREEAIVLMVTNRVFQKDAIRFLPDRYKGGVRYFIVQEIDSMWNVWPVSNLQKAMRYFPENNRDWVIYTEGMGKLFTTATDRALQMHKQYDVNVIMLDYPSIKAAWRRTRNYYFSKKNATIAYKDFMPVLDSLQRLMEDVKSPDASVNMFFHSMGNIVLEQAIKQKKLPLINENQWINNLILNAPCVPQRKHKKWLDKIDFAENIYVLYNHKDYTLGGAYFMSKKHQLGRRLDKPISKKATYINFHVLAEKKHSNFLNLKGYPPQQPSAIQLYGQLLHGMKVDLSDTSLYRKSSFRDIGWDILP